MDGIERVFGRLDRWRELPDYQLERRADIFFSLYLPEVLERELGKAFRPVIVPEFPLKHQGTNHSDKVDYLALSSDGRQLVFVELKTDCGSVRTKQFEYLEKGAKKDARSLLDDLDNIYEATRSKNKYDALFAALTEMGMTRRHESEIRNNHSVVLIAPHMEFAGRQGIDELLRDAEVPFHTISFATFGETVRKHCDPLSERFAESLEMWTKNPV